MRQPSSFYTRPGPPAAANLNPAPMRILRLLFNTRDRNSLPADEACPRTERIDKRRLNAVRAYAEEHFFGYIDAAGNLNPSPASTDPESGARPAPEGPDQAPFS